MNKWFTVSELVECPSLPNTERGCRKYLDKLAIQHPQIRRKKQGTKAFEYDLNYFPEEIQAEILLKTHRTLPTVVDVAKPEKAPIATQQLWAEWEQANERNQAMALVKHGAVTAVAELVGCGVKLLNAIDEVVRKINAKAEQEGGKGLSVGSVTALKFKKMKCKGLSQH